MTTVIDHPRRGYRTIRLALAEADYARFMSDGEFARAQLDQMHGQHPELFPEAWDLGYALLWRYGTLAQASRAAVSAGSAHGR